MNSLSRIFSDLVTHLLHKAVSLCSFHVRWVVVHANIVNYYLLGIINVKHICLEWRSAVAARTSKKFKTKMYDFSDVNSLKDARTKFLICGPRKDILSVPL